MVSQTAFQSLSLHSFFLTLNYNVAVALLYDTSCSFFSQ